MTSMSTQQHAHSTITASRTTVLAGLGLAAAATVCALVAAEPLPYFAMAAIVAGVVFGLWVVPTANGHPGRRSGVLALLAAVSLLVFSTGIPLVLAAASVACALKQRELEDRYDYPAELGLLLAALTTAVTVVLVALD